MQNKVIKLIICGLVVFVVALIILSFIMHFNEVSHFKKREYVKAKTEIRFINYIVLDSKDITELNYTLENGFKYKVLKNKLKLSIYYKKSTSNNNFSYWLMFNSKDKKITDYLVAYCDGNKIRVYNTPTDNILIFSNKSDRRLRDNVKITNILYEYGLSKGLFKKDL